MALENYDEMRDAVLDPALPAAEGAGDGAGAALPGRFIPRYAMVMFHDEIPYAVALRAGADPAADPR